MTPYRPTLRFDLQWQEAPLVQGSLFARTPLSEAANARCDHPEGAWQSDLFGDCAFCCTACGADLPEPRS